jgi:hypothetical protein
VLGRGAGVQHGERDAGSLQPVVAFGFGQSPAALKGFFHEIETLIDPITAEQNVGRLPSRHSGISSIDAGRLTAVTVFRFMTVAS